MKALFAVFAALVFASLKAQAFPEMIRHGYVHCTTCHVSPAGGGLLTAYGRSLSKELLSRWSAEGEEQIGHGFLKDTWASRHVNSDEDTGLFVGGDARFLQYHHEDETVRERKFFPMQADLEAAWRWDSGAVDAIYGVEKRGDEKKVTIRRATLISRNFETVWTRVGLASPHFGLVTSEHLWSVREVLGFGPLDRRYLVEVENEGEHWGALLGYAESDDSVAPDAREKAGYGNADLILGHDKKIGLHYWQGEMPGSTRALTGSHFLLGWNEHFVTIGQGTVQTTSTHFADTQGWYFFQKTSWEFTRGLWASLLTDFSQSDQGNADSLISKVGPGFQFFPRPHFEIQGAYLRLMQQAPNEGDAAYLILHYYL